MKRITEDWIKDPATQDVCSILEEDGAQALFVGGCVRNALLGLPISDIDIATDVQPERVMELALAAGLNAVPSGIDHGTVTVISQDVPYEITTFRRDVETDGRRAVVAYSDHIEDDAMRRDFTMNALYARSDGTIQDPLGGLDDLLAKRIRFIGSGEDRIREDYLRSLRYFRFHAWYGDKEAGFDSEALKAISENLDGLKTLSRERVGSEMLKLLGAPDPAPGISAMRGTGVLQVILPGVDDVALEPLIRLEQDADAMPDSIRRLAMIASPEQAETLRLSRMQLKQLKLIRQGAMEATDAAELGYRHGFNNGRDMMLWRLASLIQPWKDWQDQKYPWTREIAEDLERGDEARSCFPIRAADLPAFSGPELGAELARLEARWIASGFILKKESLLQKNPSSDDLSL